MRTNVRIYGEKKRSDKTRHSWIEGIYIRPTDIYRIPNERMLPEVVFFHIVSKIASVLAELRRYK